MKVKLEIGLVCLFHGSHNFLSFTYILFCLGLQMCNDRSTIQVCLGFLWKTGLGVKVAAEHICELEDQVGDHG